MSSLINLVETESVSLPVSSFELIELIASESTIVSAFSSSAFFGSNDFKKFESNMLKTLSALDDAMILKTVLDSKS